MINIEDLPTPLQPYYQKLEDAKSESAALYALTQLMRAEDKLTPNEKKQLDKALSGTIIPYRKY